MLLSPGKATLPVTSSYSCAPERFFQTDDNCFCLCPSPRSRTSARPGRLPFVPPLRLPLGLIFFFGRCSPAGDRGPGERSISTGGPGRETKRVTRGRSSKAGRENQVIASVGLASAAGVFFIFFFFKETRIEPLGPIVRPLGGHEGQGKYASSPAADAHVEAGPRGGGRCNEGVKRLAHDDEREHKR